MDPALLAAVAERLAEEAGMQRRIIAELSSELSESLGQSVQESSTYDNHPADLGSEQFERSKDFALLRRAKERLTDVLAAIDRLERGDFGHCRRCGRAIEPARLLVRPQTDLCIECERHFEGGRTRRRPVEEDVIGRAFAASFRDDRHYAGFDGEDAWQTVAGYGTSNSPQDTNADKSPDFEDAYIDSTENLGIVADVEGKIDEHGEPVLDDETERNPG